MMSRQRTLVTLVAVLAAAAPSAAQEVRRADDRAVSAAQWQHGWADGGVFYEIFVRSFADSDGDGVGDLRGLIERLDYLNDGDPSTDDDLGVTGLWLMPIFPSPSYHGYDVTDYEDVNPDYGTLADFADLMRETEQRGIRVILDLVLNHSSVEHPWFVDSATGSGSPHRDWYVWRSTNPGWTQPWGGTYPTWHFNDLDGSWYYGVFWGGMPDLDFTTPAVRAEARRLAALWLDRGADGFRLDASRYLIETGPGPGQEDTSPTHGFWQEFTASIRRQRADALIVGENWATTPVIATYYGSTEVIDAGHELPLNFNFPMSDAIIDTARTANRAPVESVLEAMQRHYPDGVRDAPFLTNHDQVRIATQLGGDAGALRSAAGVLLTLPGVPFLYYGEEVGLRNGTASGDEAKRTPMPWSDTPGGGFTTGSPWYPFAPGVATANVADQTGDPGSLLSHYRGLIRARSASPALGAGTAELPEHSSPAVFAIVREHPDQRVLALVNLTGGFLVAGALDVDGRPTRELYSDAPVGIWSGGPGNWSITLPPHGTTIWELDAP